MGPISLKEAPKDCNEAVLNRLKRISGQGPQISPSGHQGVLISSSLGSLICLLRHQRAPQINVPLRHQEPNFLFSLSGHLAPYSFPIALLRVCNFFPLRHQRAKGLKFSIAPSRVPNFLIMSSKWWPLIFHHVIKGSQFIIVLSRDPIVTSNFTSRYQGVPFIIASSRDPHFPHRVMNLNFQNLHEICID